MERLELERAGIKSVCLSSGRSLLGGLSAGETNVPRLFRGKRDVFGKGLCDECFLGRDVNLSGLSMLND